MGERNGSAKSEMSERSEMTEKMNEMREMSERRETSEHEKAGEAPGHEVANKFQQGPLHQPVRPVPPMHRSRSRDGDTVLMERRVREFPNPG